jgi:hypothetical protein
MPPNAASSRQGGQYPSHHFVIGDVISALNSSFDSCANFASILQASQAFEASIEKLIPSSLNNTFKMKACLMGTFGKRFQQLVA